MEGGRGERGRGERDKQVVLEKELIDAHAI